MGSLELKEIDFEKGEVEEEAGVYQNAWFTHIYRPAIILEESLWWGAIDIEFDDFEHLCFHLTHRISRVWILCHLKEIGDDRSVYLLEFTSDKHGRYAQQLQLIEGYALAAQVAIDYIDGDVKGLREQAEFYLDYY